MEKVALLTVSHFNPFKSFLHTYTHYLVFSTRIQKGHINPSKGKASNEKEKDPLSEVVQDMDLFAHSEPDLSYP